MKAVLRSLLCMLLILTAFVNTGCAKGADEDADYKVKKIQKLFPVHTSCRQKIRKRREEAEKKQKR